MHIDFESFQLPSIPRLDAVVQLSRLAAQLPIQLQLSKYAYHVVAVVAAAELRAVVRDALAPF